MRYVDAFNHFFPRRFFAELVQTPGRQTLDPDDKAKICHRNAERLFGLE
jgi:predicted TIM-barrel fold metal-dependent hydrolase